MYFTTAESNDIIMLVSGTDFQTLYSYFVDGVHDNLDPMFCGRSPKELNIPSEDNSWNSIKNDPLVAKVKAEWSIRLLSRLVSERKTVLNIHGKPHKTTTGFFFKN